MPIYEYDCEACGRAYDALVRERSLEDEVQCPECGSKSKKRRLSMFAAKSAGEPMKAAGGGGCNCGSCGSSNCSSCGH